jgi:hypothetical protein
MLYNIQNYLFFFPRVCQLPSILKAGGLGKIMYYRPQVSGKTTLTELTNSL